jgi:ribose-phosphate pyrophosphokinase
VPPHRVGLYSAAMDGPLTIVSGSAHPELARAICRHVGVPLGRSSTHRFSNENLKVKIEENIREGDVFVVQTSCSPVSEGILELLIMIDALKGASASRITAVLPYFPYVRSDKKDEPRISITARLMADLIETAGAGRVLTMDLHSPQVQGFFRIPADQLSAVPLICDHLAKGDLSNAVVVAPDAGEAKDAARVAKRLNVALAIIDKRRFGDDEKPRAINLVGDVRGRRAILIDDEIASAGTIVEAVSFVRAQGASRVTVAGVHAVLSGSAPERLRAAEVDEYVFTDSIPIPPEKSNPRITVLSVAELLAEAIMRIHDGRSVSALFA